MVEVSSWSSAPGAVAFLLHPSVVPIIDVFRSLDSLEDQYDLALLDGPERGLASYVQPELAKGIVSDTLLLAFSLTRQRARPFFYRPLGSRHGSVDEYCLLALIGSSGNGKAEVALEAAAFLEVQSLDSLMALAKEILRQIEIGTIVFDPPDLSEFRAMMGHNPSEDVLVEADMEKAEFNFRG